MKAHNRVSDSVGLFLFRGERWNGLGSTRASLTRITLRAAKTKHRLLKTYSSDDILGGCMSKRKKGQGLNFLIGGFKKLFLDEKAPASVRYKAGMMYGFLDAGGKWPENYFPGNDRSIPDQSPDWTDIDERASKLAKKDAVEDSFAKSIANISGGGSDAGTSSSESK